MVIADEGTIGTSRGKARCKTLFLGGNSHTSSGLILKINNGYNRVSRVLEKFAKSKGEMFLCCGGGTHCLKDRGILYTVRRSDNYELITFTSRRRFI
jgi:hypothetical protein